MNTPPKAKPSFSKRNLPLIVLTLGVLVFGLLWGAWQYQARNYAEEVASPLEASLVKAGAVKKCSRGDAGRGTDNNRPWYEVYYSLPLSKAEAVIAINKAASKAGYDLSPATPAKKGHLKAVDDAFIENWFFDDTSRPSQYGNLLSGPVKLALGANASGAQEACGNSVPITVDDKHSVVNIQVQLPEFK